MFSKRALKIFLIGLVAFALATVTYAYAAQNTMPASIKIGDNSGAISGFDVTNIAYTMDSASPANITAVTFDLDAPATTVRAGLNSSALVACGNGGSGNHWTCGVSGSVNAANTLYIAAAQ